MRWPKPRSIQQAIHCAAVFGGVALVGLFAATLLGLLGYRSAISDLDYAVHKMPRKADLAYEFSRLYQPLQLRAPTPSAKEVQKRQFLRVLAEVEQEVADFRRKVDTLPASRRKREGGDATHQLLFRIERSLRNLRQGAENGLATDVHDEQVRWMQRELTGLFAQIENLPQLGDTVRVPLSKSRRKYSNLLWLVMLSSGLALLVFGVLVYGGYRYISGSIREVVRGARRVAQRDFEYRIPVQYPEEMAELSGAFNMMTTRFQEAEQELERQVEERSRQLVRSERLADVGFLAAGVSHEINNPLHAISGAAESLEQRLPELAKDAPEEEVASVREYLRMIQRQAKRCSTITSKLKEFACKSDESRTPTNIVSIVDEVLQLVGHLSKYRDREIRFDRATPAIVEVNPSHMQQVVLNLVSNALESMDAGGRLEIDIKDQVDYVILEFRDNGCGMSEEVQQQLFEPFFTQRRTGGGTGLGLSITDRIVKDHGGTIEVQSDGPGKGSLFRVRLPRKAAQSVAA